MKSPVVRKAGLSPALVAKLNAMSPEERETAAEVASKLIQLRQAREATGQTDLTKPFDPNVKPQR